MKKKIIYFLLFLLVLTDLIYSFQQHLSQPLDGDLAWNIVPSKDVKPILESPLGLAVFENEKPYSNPNRFFCHWTIKAYFETIPFVLQKYVQPIESIYLSCAIFKILLQVILLLLLSAAISGTAKLHRMDFITAAILITSLFQTNGYRNYMGIIDSSPTYTFFYALPCALILLYFLPFFITQQYGVKLKFQVIINILWIPFALIIALSGPLNPGIALIVSLLVFFQRIRLNFNQSAGYNLIEKILFSVKLIPRNYWFYLLPLSLFSVYSLFIGMYNLNNTKISLYELYMRLPNGVYFQFSQKLGFPILFALISLNAIIIHKYYYAEEGRKLIALFKWIGLFIVIYIILLPLGGYREYRPNVLRYDTIMPVTLSLFFMLGKSTLYLLKVMNRKQLSLFVPVILGYIFIFTIADQPEFSNNHCEKSALVELSQTSDTLVRLNYDCSVLSWPVALKTEDTELNTQLLTFWGITKKNVVYTNK